MDPIQRGTDIRRLTACPYFEKFNSRPTTKLGAKSRTFPCTTFHGFYGSLRPTNPSWDAHSHRLAISTAGNSGREASTGPAKRTRREWPEILDHRRLYAHLPGRTQSYGYLNNAAACVKRHVEIPPGSCQCDIPYSTAGFKPKKDSSAGLGRKIDNFVSNREFFQMPSPEPSDKGLAIRVATFCFRCLRGRYGSLKTCGEDYSGRPWSSAVRL